MNLKKERVPSSGNKQNNGQSDFPECCFHIDLFKILLFFHVKGKFWIQIEIPKPIVNSFQNKMWFSKNFWLWRYVSYKGISHRSIINPNIFRGFYEEEKTIKVYGNPTWVLKIQQRLLLLLHQSLWHLRGFSNLWNFQMPQWGTRYWRYIYMLFKKN